MKFSELAKKCEEVNVDCDRCQHQKECSELAKYMHELSPVGIRDLVENDKEI